MKLIFRNQYVYALQIYEIGFFSYFQFFSRSYNSNLYVFQISATNSNGVEYLLQYKKITAKTFMEKDHSRYFGHVFLSKKIRECLIQPQTSIHS